MQRAGPGIGRERPPTGPGPQGRGAHQSGHVLAAARVAGGLHLGQQAARAIGPVREREARADRLQDLGIATGPPTGGPLTPRVEATARDPERLALHRNRPGPSVLRHEAELHRDSFAK